MQTTVNQFSFPTTLSASVLTFVDLSYWNWHEMKSQNCFSFPRLRITNTSWDILALFLNLVVSLTPPLFWDLCIFCLLVLYQVCIWQISSPILWNFFHSIDCYLSCWKLVCIVSHNSWANGLIFYTFIL